MACRSSGATDEKCTAQERVFIIEGHLAVELVVLRLLDVARLLPPEGGRFIHALVADVDRESDVIRVATNNLPQAPFIGELVRFFFQFEDDRRAALCTFGSIDNKTLAAV
jgi:hypothetical protein